ncbi:MAG: energy-coupling factor transporter ATPase [Clostridiales bacterium GWF2_38_85]|nr:MAG: energy-coupling factor transporter ATPase [Clostridiales bacterium GWF2_38_85]HBL83510.1 energy-coupling factor transporter ATPase [Clostridiales bacterium]
MYAIELDNISVVYGKGTPFEKVALKNIDLKIELGSIVGLIGHTGSGKSTLVRLLNGLLKPTEGRVLINGEDIWLNPKQVRKFCKKVGLVFQYPEYQLFEETVYKDIAFGPKNMGMTGETLNASVRSAAKFCGIDDEMLDRSPFEISGGQKRRVAIAGVIAMQPEILVLDEPAAGLDPRGREEILSGLVEYKKSSKSTMVIVSHSMEDIAKYADSIIVLKDNMINMQGTVKEIFTNAVQLFGAGLDVPQITKLFIELEKRGLSSRVDIYTVTKATELMKECLGGTHHAE